MLPLTEDRIRNDAAPVRNGQFNFVPGSHLLLIQNRAENGLPQNFLKNGILRPVEKNLFVNLCQAFDEMIQRPDLDPCHFKGVQNIHGHRISALVGEVPTYSATDLLLGLTDINRLGKSLGVLEFCADSFCPRDIKSNRR